MLLKQGMKICYKLLWSMKGISIEEISVCDFMNSEIADKIYIISKKDLQRLVTFFGTASFDEIMMVLKAVVDKETQSYPESK